MPDLRSRVVGCLLGGALGDALGAPLEFLSLDEIRRRYGQHGLSEFVPAYGRLGAITDDTQMTLFTAEGLIEAAQSGQPPRQAVHRAYLRWLATQGHAPSRPLPPHPAGSGGLLDHRELHEQRGPGRTCITALMSGRAGTVEEPINDSKGCGGIMRIAPVGLICAGDGSGLCGFDLGCDLAALTHGHPSGYLAAGAFAQAVAGVATHGDLNAAISGGRAALQTRPQHGECLAALDKALQAAETGDASAERVQSLGEGWVAEEALAICVYCALVARDFRHGISLAANHSGDSDSTAALTGNLLGAKWGREALPTDLLADLELREVIESLALRLVAASAPT